jgi:hypothetical protein
VIFHEGGEGAWKTGKKKEETSCEERMRTENEVFRGVELSELESLDENLAVCRGTTCTDEPRN